MKKKHLPKVHKALRKMNEGFHSFTNANGTITFLNITKHLMLNEPYKNKEYQEAMIAHARRKIKMQTQKETYLDKEKKKEDNVKKETKDD